MCSPPSYSMVVKDKWFLLTVVICLVELPTIVGKQSYGCSYTTVDSYLVANCSSRNLSEVPRDLRKSTIILSLSHNKISELQAEAFGYLPNLIVIDLSFNNISILTPGSFTGIPALMKLYLNNNHLGYKSDVFPPGIFNGLRQLRVLNIGGNNVDFASPALNYPQEALRDLVSLRELVMDGITNKMLGDGFRNLTHLRNLTMSGYDDTCHIGQISNQTFYNLGKTQIRVLNLSSCDIQSIERGAFSELNTIESLSLRDNYYITFDGVKNVTFSLKFTNITYLDVGYIDKHAKAPIFLKSDVFTELTNTSLKSLILNGNEIAVIEKSFAFALPKSIEYISLRDNKLSDSKFLQKLYVLEKLHTFDVSYQYHNRKMKLSDFRKIQKSKYNNDEPYRLPPNLRYLLGSHLKINLLLIPSISIANNSLKYLDMSFNEIKYWVGKITGLKDLEFLDASHLGLKMIGNSVFGDMPELRKLNLNNNLIGQHLMEDVKFLTFSNQSKLVELDLSHCDISDLPKYIFSNLKKLKKLHLNKNPLVELKFHLANLRNVEYFDLSDTEIRSLSKQNMQEINKIIDGRNKSLKLNMKGNLFKCTCDEREFLQWMQAKRHVIDFVDLHTYTCTLQNGSVTSLTNLDGIISDLYVQCISTTVILASGISFVLLCLLLAIPALYYYKRWKFKYLLYVKRRQLKPYQPLTNEDISHSELSVAVERIKNVLTYKGFRIFDPADDIKGNQLEVPEIAKGIEHSTVVIALLTPEYVQDYLRIF